MTHPPRPTRGAALVTSLLLLVVLTIVGVTSLGNTVLQERMAGNTRARDISFQAAEAALRDGERYAQDNPVEERVFYDGGTSDGDWSVDNDGDDCVDGLCTPREYDEDFDDSLAPGDTGYLYERFSAQSSLDVWNTPSRHRTYDTDEFELAEDPKYIIEFLGYSPPAGTVTACDGNGDGEPDPPYDVWPYCPSDPPKFRVTAMATGPDGNTPVMLQSTFRRQ